MVAGLNFLGLSAIINAKYRNAKVIAFGQDEYHMDIARKLGADYILNAEDPDWLNKIREITGYRQGVDYCYECSGVSDYQNKCMEAVRRYGGVYFMGFLVGSKEKLPIHITEQITNNHIFLTGGHDVSFRVREGLVNMLLEKRVQDKIDILVTHEFPMSHAQEAFEVALSKKCGKIFLCPWE
jgi:threonine dehydrogenase-like Zn-dependent dehydrogenase